MQHPSRIPWLLIAMLIAGFVADNRLNAQDTGTIDSSAWVQLPEDAGTPNYFYLGSGENRLPPDDPSASYEFSVLDETLPIATYRFGDCRKNGKLLKLLGWKWTQLSDADAVMLGTGSRTANFRLRKGDTLSFYRQLFLSDPQNNYHDTSNYFSRDTLSFCVELVRASDSTRIAVLDSMSVLPSDPPGFSIIYGIRPIVAAIRYVAPLSLNGDSAFIRVRPRADEIGEYHFNRRDGILRAIPQVLANPYWANYMAIWNRSTAKRVPGELAAVLDANADDAQLAVQARPGVPRDIVITFSIPTNWGLMAITVFNASGELVSYPFTSNTISTDTREVDFHAPDNGEYYIGMLRNGRLITTRKISVAK